MTKRLVSVDGNPFFRDAEGVWLSLHEWKRLAELNGLFDEVLFLKPQIGSRERPEGWARMAAEGQFEGLCQTTDHRLLQRWKTIRKVKEVLREGDVLHVLAPTPAGYWAHLPARQCGSPVIAEIVGEPETAVLEEDGRGLLRNLTRRFRSASARRQQERICREAACVISVGPALARQYVPPRVPALVSTVHLLEEEHYRPRTEFRLGDPPLLLFVGQIQRRKGLHVLFQALAALRVRVRDFRMVLIGTGPQERPLLALASELGFAEKVDFRGYAAHGEALFEEFKKADLFVLPSVAAEGVPRVTHEAMAFGCPVVATDVGSVAWQLRDGAGIVVPPHSAQALTDAIERVLESESLRRQLSEKGYQRSLEHTFEKQRAEKLVFLREQCEL